MVVSMQCTLHVRIRASLMKFACAKSRHIKVLTEFAHAKNLHINNKHRRVDGPQKTSCSIFASVNFVTLHC